MAADFNKPVTTDNYVDLLAMLRANQDVLARMFATGVTVNNIPVGAVRFEAGKFQTWNCSAWVDVPVSIDGGGTGAQSAAAARVALGTHDAANLTTGVMSADRVPGMDASKIVSGTLTRDTTGVSAGAPWSGITSKPAFIGAGATALEARQSIESTGNDLQLVWSGSAKGVNLDTLPGGHPGRGIYLIDTNSKLISLYITPGLASSTVFDINSPASPSITTRHVFYDGTTVVSEIRNSSGATAVTINAIYKVV